MKARMDEWEGTLLIKYINENNLPDVKPKTIKTYRILYKLLTLIIWIEFS